MLAFWRSLWSSQILKPTLPVTVIEVALSILNIKMGKHHGAAVNSVL